ncbi:Protein of unknown function [Granulicella rosea]|uniref:DUF1569 domain-containing protein n=1 Tax=Granulicella rosea TaxID=474952 RepID=A0A239E4H4_9BACT|nr:DUF1569 domain-containing protein [Granulicella rosea]SNS38852.1 Protein of unknown function [Granulicella rosea]
MKTLAQPRDLRELQGRLAELTPADAPRWGRMSVGQMVCHLREAFSAPLGERSVAPVKPPIPGPFIKWLALSVPTAWPKIVPAPLELKISGCPAPVSHVDDRVGVQAKMLQFADRREIAAPHPFFGRMTTEDWMRWGYLHTDHHLRQFGR